MFILSQHFPTCDTSFSQHVCPLSQVDLTPCPDGITTILHLYVCVCGRGGEGYRDSGAPGGQVSLTCSDLYWGHSEVGAKRCLTFLSTTPDPAHAPGVRLCKCECVCSFTSGTSLHF